MIKKLETIVSDIYGLFGSGKTPDQQDLDDLGKAMASHIATAFQVREPKGTLRASNIGTKCNRKLWYAVNQPDKAEDVPPWTKIKFLYGNLLEELVLFLAREAGHKVEHLQREVDVAGVKGHIDAVVDGTVLDVKTANSRGMHKFKGNGLLHEDPFGYLAQIDFYRTALKDDPSVTEPGVAFLAIDKELGHLVLDEYDRSDIEEGQVEREVITKQMAVSDPTPPVRGYFPILDGRSGNMQLDLQCRYCEFKKTCWPSLRTFAYAGGPRFLTKVVKEPDVPEIFSKSEKKV